MPLSRTLHVELTDLAKSLQRHGRGRDSVLAHITPKEAMLLKARGGRGSTNPVTGLLEFDDAGGIENVNVTAPTFEPNIEAPPPPPPTQTQAPEQVTVSANAAPSSINVPTDFSFQQAAAPQVAQAAPVQQPAPAQVAPEQVTVNAPTTGGPAIGAFQAPIPTPRPDDQTDQSTNDQTKSWLDRNKTLIELGGLGALGLYGGINSRNAAGQAAALQNNLANIATPLSNAGNAALSGVQSGALTPANLQALQAVQAQTAQGQKSGAVSSQQAAEAVSTTFANLLNNQLNQAMALLNQADGYLQTAYIQGYQANIANQTNTQNFYSNLAQLAARMAGVGGGTTINLGAGA